MKANPLSVEHQFEHGSVERTLFGHPRGLTILILTGLWENAALFGMRTVLIYYLVNQLKLPNGQAIGLYTLFSASAFIGFVGSAIADKIIGLRRGVLAGIALMAAGLPLLLWPAALVPALLMIAAGSGLVRPTLTAQVGLLYEHDDPRRDRGFTAYYVGINIGATIAPFIFGTVGELFGWSLSFVASGLGMVLAMAIYVGGWAHLRDGQSAAQAQSMAPDGGALKARQVLSVLAFVWLGGVCFWAAYGQLGSTIALWVESGINRSITGFGKTVLIPATWFQSINPILIFIFGPVVTWLWRREHGPQSVARELRKMAIGGVLLSLAFVVLALAAEIWPSRTGFIWLVLAIAPLTMGELYWTPVGLGLFSRLALGGFVAVFVGAFGFAMMAGFAVSGVAGQLWGKIPSSEFFGLVAVISIGASLLVLIAVRRSLHFRRPQDT